MASEDIKSKIPEVDFGLWRPPRAMGLARALQKAGYGTRKQMVQLVSDGKVEVNDEPTRDPLFPVDPESVITIDGHSVSVLERSYFAINKPARVLCSPQDGRNWRLLDDFFPVDVPGLVAAGRLDGRTTGLILVSNDTAWNNNFTECADMEQEYRIQFEGELSALELDMMKAGVQLPGGGIYKPQSIAMVEVLNGFTVINMVVVGKIRLVRHLLRTLQHKVVYMRRLRLGSIRLAFLPVGKSRALTTEEIQFIKNCHRPAVNIKDPESEK
jgi:pseudouridine synthase